ncbi:MAG TPA: hypothetical protein VG435_07150 [Acidimicrobiales bacterium]|jgi:hypothetical protein|nr:hypothetical protein [Acidimicrobiales bacterium]
MAEPVPVYLEEGRSKTFACAVDWPGWCRSGKGADAALEALDDYRPRYRAATGRRVPAGAFEVIGSLPGAGGTDFGVPAQFTGEWDQEPLRGADLARYVRILQASWAALDRLAVEAPESLAKGPRGGGRDRDKVVAHVRDAERAYGPSMGIRLPSKLTWDEQRDTLVAHLKAYGAAKWPLRYAFRRVTWHILDHVWEIEDRS